MEETKRKLDVAHSHINSYQRDKQLGLMQLGEGDRYQRQYIEALSSVENYTTLSAKYDRRIKLARMHLEVKILGGFLIFYLFRNIK